jgi:hypothetical protein
MTGMRYLYGFASNGRGAFNNPLQSGPAVPAAERRRPFVVTRSIVERSR